MDVSIRNRHLHVGDNGADSIMPSPSFLKIAADALHKDFTWLKKSVMERAAKVRQKEL